MMVTMITTNARNLSRWTLAAAILGVGVLAGLLTTPVVQAQGGPACLSGCTEVVTESVPDECTGDESRTAILYISRVGPSTGAVKIEACYLESGVEIACLRETVVDEDVWLQVGQQSRVVKLVAPAGSHPDHIRIYSCVGSADVTIMHEECETCGLEDATVCDPLSCGGLPSYNSFYGGCLPEGGSCTGPVQKQHDAQVFLFTTADCTRILYWWDVRSGCTTFSTPPTTANIPGSPDGGVTLGYRLFCKEADVREASDRVLRLRYQVLEGNTVHSMQSEGCCTFNQLTNTWTCSRIHGGTWYGLYTCGLQSGMACP